MSERVEELKQRQREAASAIQAQAQTLGATADPKVAREARDAILERVEYAVESVDVQARIRDRPVEDD